jgi:hypothetical protein
MSLGDRVGAAGDRVGVAIVQDFAASFLNCALYCSLVLTDFIDSNTHKQHYAERNYRHS